LSKLVGLFLMVLLVPVLAQSTGEIPQIEIYPEIVDIACTINSDSEFNSTKNQEILNYGIPVIYYGENAELFNELYNFSLTLTGETDNSTNNVVLGGLVYGTDHGSIEHSLVIKDYSYESNHIKRVNQWVFDTLEYPLTSFPVTAVRTELEYQEPYGVLETLTEIIQIDDTSSEFDWYDVTVSQTLTPGANSSGSDWEWEWLTYTMNGSRGESNVFLSDYDQPPSGDLPTGLFSFLWRILNFNPRDLLPWFYPPPVMVEGVDMSDFSRELFNIRYQAPDRYQKANEPLEVRHHYVLRVREGEPPRFWQQSQVKYVKGNVIAAPPFYSTLLGEGYLELR
jgi:hypothetical protein